METDQETGQLSPGCSTSAPGPSWKATEDGPGTNGPVTHMGDPDGNPAS